MPPFIWHGLDYTGKNNYLEGPTPQSVSFHSKFCGFTMKGKEGSKQEVSEKHKSGFD